MAKEVKTAEDTKGDANAAPEGEGKARLVPKKYVEKYGKARSNQDEIANALKEYVADDKGKIDEAKLAGVAKDNGLSEKLHEYQGKNLNVGMQRMNIGNLLRGLVNKGHDVKIGKTTIRGKPIEKKEKASKEAA